MKTIIEKVDISITTKRNALPIEKPVAGRFRISEDCSVASFHEEDATIIFGESKSKRIYQGSDCSIWWNPEKQKYTVRLQIEDNPCAVTKAEWNAEDCLNYIKRRMLQ